MPQERKGAEPQYPFHSFCRPDGSFYSSIYLPPTLNSTKLFKIGEDTAQIAKNTGMETRVLIDSKNQIDLLGGYMRQEGIKVAWGGNRHFSVNLKDKSMSQLKHEFTGIAWDNYEKNFRVKRVNPKDKTEKEILKSLVYGSFGLDNEKLKKIQSVFDASLNNTPVYFVVGNGVLGSFALEPLLGMKEIQLHSVAGWSDHSDVMNISDKKLPIIMAGVFEAINLDYPQQRSYGIGGNGTIHYSGIDALTLSTSGDKRIEMYRGLGFKFSRRHGIVIYP